MKKKLVSMLVISLILSVSIAMTVFAYTSPYVVDSGVFLDLDESFKGKINPRRAEKAVYPNYVPGYWWRNPENQNLLAEHTATEFGNQLNQLQSIYTSRLLRIYCWTAANEGNIYLIHTIGLSEPESTSDNDRFIIVGTGGSLAAAAAARTAFENAGISYQNAKLGGIVYLDTDVTSVTGVSAFMPEGIDVPVYADSSFEPALQKEVMIRAARTSRTARMQGWTLRDDSSSAMIWDTDWYLGLGSGYEPTQSAIGLEAQPTILEETENTVVLNKVAFTFLPSGEDGIMNLFIPGHKILFLGMPFGKYFPDVAPLNGKILSADNISAQFGTLLTHSSNVIAPLHGQAVLGNPAAMALLTDQRTALDYVRTETIRQANLGLSIDSIVAQTRLPADLAASPYVQEFTTTIASAIRAIYAEYFGWFDGDVTGLETIDETTEAALIVELAGGPNKLLAKAKKANESTDITSLQQALYMVHAVRLVKPSNDATLLYAMILKKLAYSQTSAQMRNYYLTEARLAQDSLTAQPCP